MKMQTYQIILKKIIKYKILIMFWILKINLFLIDCKNNNNKMRKEIIKNRCKWMMINYKIFHYNKKIKKMIKIIIINRHKYKILLINKKIHL